MAKDIFNLCWNDTILNLSESDTVNNLTEDAYFPLDCWHWGCMGHPGKQDCYWRCKCPGAHQPIRATNRCTRGHRLCLVQ
eukprot:scaffold2556_cov425-Prasinococcus_capsulatus_cf.AAC.3